MRTAVAVSNLQLGELTASKQVCCWQKRSICFITSYNDGNNTVGPFHALPDFLFTTSETKRNY